MTDDPSVPRHRWRARLRRVRWGRWVVIGLVALAVAVTFGVTTASTQSSLGPHEARYDVTTDHAVTLDLGPLGTLQIDSPLPLTLGARVTVEEIPANVSSVDPAKTIAALSSDLQGYVQFFSAPEATLTDVASALLLDAALRSAGAFGALAAIVVVVRLLLGATRRAELVAVLALRRRDLVGSGLLALIVAVTAVSSLNPSEEVPAGRPASSVFDGTPLDGARITGRLAGVIDTYGGEVIKAYRANAEFYAVADRALVAAWKFRAAKIVARDEARRLLQAPPLVGPDPTPEPVLAKVKPVVMLMISDLHCNVGMEPLIRSVATLAKADIVLDGGDTTLDGTAVEQYCVTTFARAVPKGVPIVVSDGNHDSSETSAQERRAGYTVLDGKTVTVAGVRILGDVDPNQTRIAGGTSLSGKETETEAGDRLAKTACADGDVDLLLIHTPTVGAAALASGCVPVQLSGHLHVTARPALVGKGTLYVSSTTAGAASGQLTVGPLHGTAQMTVLRFDPATHRMLDYQLIDVRPDQSASVGNRIAFPQPVAPAAGNGPLASGRSPSP